VVIASANPPTTTHVCAFSLFRAFSRREINLGSRSPSGGDRRPARALEYLARFTARRRPATTVFVVGDAATVVQNVDVVSHRRVIVPLPRTSARRRADARADDDDDDDDTVTRIPIAPVTIDPPRRRALTTRDEH
jgi:hypothetical protein